MVVDGVRDVVWVTWHADSVVGGGGWRSQRCLCDVARVDCVGGGERCSQHRSGDVARGRRCGGWWMVLAMSFG